MPIFDLRISRMVRVVGILGLLYEIFLDRLANPTALVVFSGLAEGPDLFSYWTRLRMPPQQPKPPEDEPPPSSSSRTS